MKNLAITLYFLLLSTGINAQCPLGTITFASQAAIDNFSTTYPGCTHILGSVTIDGIAVNNLNGLSAVTSIGGNFFLRQAAGLTNLTGLNALTSIVGGVSILSNPDLTNFMGAEALTQVGALSILYNPALTSLTGLDALTSTGSLLLGENAGLTDLNGLENVTSTNNLSIINHPALTSVGALNHPISINGNLEIRLNPLLSNCTAQAICDYLANPPASIFIWDNATSCNVPEVYTNCNVPVPVPVELLSFTGKNIDHKVQLSWQTATERNNDYFQVDHSRDGRNFKNIGLVKSHGNAVGLQAYTFIHPHPSSGVNYYRLKQVDLDGKSEYSGTISVTIESDEISIFPNPTAGMVEIRSKDILEGTMRLTDQVGRLIKTLQLYDYQQIDISDLPNGIYFIEILTDSQSITRRVIKE